MNKKEISREFNVDFSELRKIINSWNLIPGSPSDEHDSLNHKILSQLYRVADNDKIGKVIESELIVNYGFFRHEINVKKYAFEILDWWNTK